MMIAFITIVLVLLTIAFIIYPFFVSRTRQAMPASVKSPSKKQPVAINIRNTSGKEGQVCPNCGARRSPEARFCRRCGSRLAGAQNKISRSSSSQKKLQKEIKLLKSRLELENDSGSKPNVL